MAGTYGQPGYVPTSGPVDFESLYVKGVEVIPNGSGASKIAAVKPIDLKGDVDAAVVAKKINELIAAFKVAGIMETK